MVAGVLTGIAVFGCCNFSSDFAYLTCVAPSPDRGCRGGGPGGPYAAPRRDRLALRTRSASYVHQLAGAVVGGRIVRRQGLSRSSSERRSPDRGAGRRVGPLRARVRGASPPPAGLLRGRSRGAAPPERPASGLSRCQLAACPVRPEWHRPHGGVCRRGHRPPGTSVPRQSSIDQSGPVPRTGELDRSWRRVRRAAVRDRRRDGYRRRSSGRGEPAVPPRSGGGRSSFPTTWGARHGRHRRPDGERPAVGVAAPAASSAERTSAHSTSRRWSSVATTACSTPTGPCC